MREASPLLRYDTLDRLLAHFLTSVSGGERELCKAELRRDDLRLQVTGRSRASLILDELDETWLLQF